jgi:hypothetical protein
MTFVVDIKQLRELTENHDEAFDYMVTLPTDDLIKIKFEASRRKVYHSKEIMEMAYLDGAVGAILRERGDYGTKKKEKLERKWNESGRT